MSTRAGLIDELAAWAIALRPADIPTRVYAGARLQLLSVLASIYAGAPTSNAGACRRAALALGTRGGATLLPSGEQVHPVAAALANAAASMEHDFDDYLFLGHTGHSAVTAALAVAEDAGASLEDALVAQIAANEIAGRLGAYVALGPQNGQLWSHIHIAAAVVCAARIYGLTATQTADALGIGLYQPPFALQPGFFGSDAKVLTAAQPTAFGLYAARLAAEGMRGSRDLLEHRRGFGSHFAFVPIPAVLGGLGRSWVSDSLSYKIYPGCAYIDAPVDAVLEATGGRAIPADEIEDIEIASSAVTAGMELLGEESAPATSLEPIAINFSARRSAAIAALTGELTPSQLSPRWLAAHRRDILAVAARSRLRESRQLTLDLLDGLGRAISLPRLLRLLGVRGLLDARRRMTEAFDHRSRRARAGSGRASQPVRARVGDAWSSVRAAAGALRGRPGAFDMAVADFSRLEFRFGAEVTITLRVGRILHGRQSVPLGAAGRDPAETRALVVDKLRATALGETARSIEELVFRGEASARQLGEACAAC